MKLRLAAMAIAFVIVCLFAKTEIVIHSSARADDPAKARAAFKDASKVFFSPRCVNCHPAGDTPLIGDSSKQHEQGVKRGPDGKGVPGLECNTCHQEENLDGESLPPGAPNWQMPPAATKMSFQNVTLKQLCTQLKDPSQNGGKKTPKDAIHHIKTDGRVHWAWAPGGGRTTPPMGFDEFVKKMNEWVNNGAACPE